MSTSALSWRKRSVGGESPIDPKRAKPTVYYFQLESDSPTASDDDTESIYSIQDKETDIVRDTSDTESEKSEEYELEIEYDIASLSGSDGENFMDSSTDSEDMMALAAAVVCDSSLETFITDAEDSDNSRQDDSSTGLTDFWTCMQCKLQNDNPQFQFCDKCFQDRKTFFPPRPRRYKKSKRKEKKLDSPVKLDALKSCLSGLSQDSGIGSSQEFPSLCLDQIVVPKHLGGSATTSSSSSSSSGTTSLPNNDNNISLMLSNSPTSRKRQISESSLSEDYDYTSVSRPKKCKTKTESIENGKSVEDSAVKTNDVAGETTKTIENDVKQDANDNNVKGSLPELKEICIICNTNPKNSVFLHGRIAHMCCCYKCAMKTWKALKRCPICKRKVSNVVRVFTT